MSGGNNPRRQESDPRHPPQSQFPVPQHTAAQSGRHAFESDRVTHDFQPQISYPATHFQANTQSTSHGAVASGYRTGGVYTGPVAQGSHLVPQSSSAHGQASHQPLHTPSYRQTSHVASTAPSGLFGSPPPLHATYPSPSGYGVHQQYVRYPRYYYHSSSVR